MSNLIRNYNILNFIHEESLEIIKFLYIFGERGRKILIVDKNDYVYYINAGKKGFNDKNSKKINLSSFIIEQLCGININKFFNGFRHIVALTDDGKLYSWGDDTFGQRGERTYDYSNSPNLKRPNNAHEIERINNFEDAVVKDISCGYYHNLALMNNGDVYAWGRNNCGQIGIGIGVEMQSTPIKLELSKYSSIKQIACGFHHSLALTENGEVLAWGENQFGQLGIGSYDNTYNPVLVKFTNLENSQIKKISCSADCSYFLNKDGRMYTCGRNDFGQLGIQNQKNKKFPVLINCPFDFVDLVTTNNCYIKASLSSKGIFFIWGQYENNSIDSPVETSFKCFHEIFSYFSPRITYETLKNQNDIIFENTIQKNKFDETFREVKLIDQGKSSVIFSVLGTFNNEIDAVKKIPLTTGSSKKALEFLPLISFLRSDFIVQYKSVWFERNISNYSELKNNFEQIEKNHEIFSNSKTELLHIKMELCYKSLKGALEQLELELSSKPLYVKNLVNFFVAGGILIEILECLLYLHNLNIKHGNLKTTNILVFNGTNGRFIKLSDSRFLNYSLPDTSYTRKDIVSSDDVFNLGKIALELFNIADINEYVFFKNIKIKVLSTVFYVKGN